MDFACKKFDIEDVIKCSLGLTKAEFSLMKYLCQKERSRFTTQELADNLKMDLSTVQRGVKKLHEKDMLLRTQANLTGGGYIFYYQIKSRGDIKKIVESIIAEWAQRFSKEIDDWSRKRRCC